MLHGIHIRIEQCLCPVHLIAISCNLVQIAACRFNLIHRQHRFSAKQAIAAPVNDKQQIIQLNVCPHVYLFVILLAV
ncbi:hypothetical protein D3C78_779860 [compost metagenome]